MLVMLPAMVAVVGVIPELAPVFTVAAVFIPIPVTAMFTGVIPLHLLQYCHHRFEL